MTIQRALKISPLLQSLPLGVADAAVSMLRPSNRSLRKMLHAAISSPPGSADGITGDPAFEAMFGWRQASHSLKALVEAGLLDAAFVRALESPPERYAKEYTFPSSRRPFSHQLAAWEAALKERKHVLVSSGTGSGKTESFLFPILSELAREAAGARLEGVRALFIYPLNALIRSQRERLTAWTEPFGDSLRFCLYNGRLERELPGHQRQAMSPAEVPDRVRLWQSPPPLLITNTTMLEYMLVRHIDAPILQASRGKLRWIVIDEAHSYMGTQAAELALQLRRTMEAFGVRPEDVQVIATSATIGDDSAASDEALCRFLADLSGVSSDRVAIVRGQRDVPVLPATAVSSAARIDELESIDDSANLFDALAGSATAVQLRSCLAEAPRSLSQLSSAIGSPDALTARWLDVASSGVARDRVLPDGSDSRFLPLRSHIMQRTVEGAWACINADCSGRAVQELDEHWKFGAIFLDERTECAHCDSKLFPLRLCVHCGHESLDAVGVVTNGSLMLVADGSHEDDYLCDVDAVEGEETDEDTPGEISAENRKVNYLLLPKAYPKADAVTERIQIDRNTGMAYTESWQTEVLAIEHGKLRACPECDGAWRGERTRREVRVSGPFTLGTVIPELLQAAPADPDVGAGPEALLGGRRLLAFTDSRQGTARGAVRLFDRSLRDFVRSTVPHLLAEARASGLSSDEREAQELARQAYEQKLDSLGADESGRAELAKKIAAIDAKLNPALGVLAWREMAQRLASKPELTHIARYYDSVANGLFSQPYEAADQVLLRELYRRPKRSNSLETMGLVELRYPALTRVPVPASWRSLGGQDSEWREFLVIVLNTHVRENAAVDLSEQSTRWMGAIIQPKRLYRSRDQVPRSGNGESWGPQMRPALWPAPLRRGSRPAHRLHRILFAAFGLDVQDSESLSLVNDVLNDAFTQLIGGASPVLIRDGNGYFLRFQDQAIAEPENVWLCPITGRLLSTTLRGISPYLVGVDGVGSRAKEIALPRIPLAFWQEGNDIWTHPKRKAWLEQHASVGELRELGVWNEAMDMAYQGSAFFAVREHSAQIASATLERITDEFKAGKVNVLNCSTTMEMGVDIGGLSVVAMTNPPPLPANYLQRAGRAGRRGETRALAYTLCRPEPRAQALFEAPGAFLAQITRVPRVSLESGLIVQRHINAWLLGYYLNLPSTPQGDKQEVGAFFGAADATSASSVASDRNVSPATGLSDLLRSQALDARAQNAVTMIVRGSTLSGRSLEDLARTCSDALDSVVQGWWSEYVPLLIEREGLTGAAANAVSQRLERMRQTNLLALLTERGFLPAHGFPTHVRELVVSDNANLENEWSRRDDSLSRPMAIALREYQPGADVVVNGAKYRVGGVTLNWKRPASEDEGRSLQNFRWFVRCGSCGLASEESYRPDECGACGESGHRFVRIEYLEPAGFAVAADCKPTDDISLPTYRAIDPPEFSVDAAWIRLPGGLGQMRASSGGEIFHVARGEHGAGFEICLRCGRAESASADRAIRVLEPRHSKIRRKSICDADKYPWAIRRVDALGSREQTDVLELQLLDAAGRLLNDQAVALSVAVLLRNAAAEQLGVEPSELGFGSRQSVHGGQQGHSIILFDRASGGAGYVTRAVDDVGKLIRRAAELANCQRECERACTHCMLSYDAKEFASELDRKKVLELLTDAVTNKLALPKELQVFGTTTVAETSPVAMAVRRAVGGSQAPCSVRVFVSADDEWDAQGWPFRQVILQAAAEGHATSVRVVLTTPVRDIDDGAREDLFAWLESGLIHGVETVVTGADEVTPLAEVECGELATSWAIAGADDRAQTAGPAWGSNGVILKGSSRFAYAYEPVAAEQLQPSARGGNAGHVTIKSHGAFPARNFGAWLVGELEKVLPSIKEKIHQRPVRMSYSDRYFRSPDSPAVLAAFVRAVAAPCAGDAKAPLEIRTAELEQSFGRTGNSRDFSNEGERTRAVVSAFKDRTDLQVSTTPRKKTLVDHARLLTAEYADGSKLTIQLDQGVDFWACDPPLGMDGRIRPKYAKQSTKVTAWIE